MSNTEVAADRSLVLPENVLIRQVDDEVVLLDLDSEKYFAVDGAGAQFLHRLVEFGTIANAAEVLTTEFDASIDVLVDDLQSLTASLLSKGLLHLS